jgi:hypothetical protein
MIRLKSLLEQTGLQDRIRIEGIGTLTCKWDTGADTKASALHATAIQREGDTVTWSTAGRTHTAPVTGESKPKGRDTRLTVELECEWRGRLIRAPFALTDRSGMSTEVLCNLALMRQLGVSVDLHTGLQ